MATIAELKAQTQAVIEARSPWLIDIAKTILSHPEPGFQEVTTARLVSDKLHELGIAHDTGIALTGIKCYIRGGKPGPKASEPELTPDQEKVIREFTEATGMSRADYIKELKRIGAI